MRCTLLALTLTAILGGSALAVRAEDPSPPKPADTAKKADAKPDFKAERAAHAKLQVKFHRAIADLIEAQSAENPDKATIEKLTKAVEQVRKELQANRPKFQGKPGMGPGGPGMGPGMGRGMGPGGPGMGPGGPGGPDADDDGPGMGPGGPGMGPPPGMGRGMGPGRGRGMGPGPGMGNGGQGRGPGPRGGPGYIDRDEDGVCDRYENAQGQK